MARYNLIDLGLNDYSMEEKREIFMLLDIKMKQLHDQNKVIRSFEPYDIYYEDGKFNFSAVSDISTLVVDNKEEAIVDNIIKLSVLAFCTYLPGYDIMNGLLHELAVHNKFEGFTKIFDEEDLGYYRAILVDTYKTRTLPETPYYYDYVIKTLTSSGKESSMALVKATEVGRLMADNNKEAAFSNIFLFVTITACLVLEAIGVVIYYLNK